MSSAPTATAANDLISRARSNTPANWTAMHRMRSTRVHADIPADAAAAIAEELRTQNLLQLYAQLPPTPTYLTLRDKIYKLILERLDV
jgi:hypothetical protein